MADKSHQSPEAAERRLAAAREREEIVVTAAIRDLDPIRRAAENGDVDRVSAGCDKLSEQLRRPEFPRNRAKELVEIMMGLRRVGFVRKVDELMVQAINAARQGDVERKAEMLTKSREFIQQAIRYGADEAFRHSVEKRMATLKDTSGHSVDHDANRRAEIEAARKRKRTPPPPEAARRKAIRYVAPSLRVTIGGESYKTVDWSIRGLLIGDVKGLPHIGERLHLDVALPGLDAGGRITGRVVRVDAPPRSVAVDLGEINTTVLQIVKLMKDEGFVPVPEY